MTAKLAPGDKAPDFTLPATDGSGVHLLAGVPGSDATVVMFICNHCPYVQAYIPRLIDLQRQFPTARFLAICSNDAANYPEDSFEHMKQQAQAWGLNFPYLHDESQDVARSYGAERTPEIFVLDREGVCRYEGGIDDNYKDPTKVTEQPLRDALAALVAGRPVPQPQTYAIGCSVKWRKS